jgi:PST family polysaccharide transporter
MSQDHSENQLKNQSIHGSLCILGAEVVSQVLRIGGTMILARLLMPEHFGLIGMVTALTGIAERFKDFGLDIATLQRKKITHAEISTLFWINTCVGMLIALVVACLAPGISWFYGDPRLLSVTLAISSGFVFGGLTIQHQALLRRNMQFLRIAAVQFAATALSVSAAILFACWGFTYWALVWKEVLRAFIAMAGTWLMCSWFPSLPKWQGQTWSMLKSGRDVTVFNFTYFLSKSSDQILLGKFWDATSLGLYRQADQLISLPIQFLYFPLSYVMVPVLSRLQDKAVLFRNFYLKAISILSFFLMPITIYLIIFSEDIIVLTLGPNWVDAASIFRVLALAAFIQPVETTSGVVMICFGRTRRYLNWGILHSVSLIVSFIIGVHWGAQGLAIAYAAKVWVTLVPSLWYSFRDSPLSSTLFLKAIKLPITSSVILASFLLLLSRELSDSPTLIRLGVSLPIALFLYIGTWLLIPGGRKLLQQHGSSLFLACSNIFSGKQIGSKNLIDLEMTGERLLEQKKRTKY